MKTTKKEYIDKKRRGFIKKSVYRTPLLIALGSLIKPQKAIANFDDLRSVPPPPPPGFTGFNG